jgi:hypothetical protein
MKSWWPWRNTKPLLTLFSERVPWPDETPETKILVLPPLDERHDRPHPKNAPGGFYVVDRECISCGVPLHMAPELIEWEKDSEVRPNHCYFHKQPETALELIHAVKAVEGSCCGAVRYRGSDSEIIKKLKDAGCKNAIDLC